VSSQNTVLRSGLTLVVSFKSYCVLAHSYLRNGQTGCYHITHNDSRDTVIVHGTVILILTKIQVTVLDRPMWAREHCRISSCRFIAECRKKRVNEDSFVLLCFVVCFFSVVLSFSNVCI